MERLTPVELRAPGGWQIATVTEIKQETPRVKSFRFALNEDAMATEKTAEGIRVFSADIVKLEQVLATKR